MEIREFEPEHFRALVLQDHQEAWRPILEGSDWRHLGDCGVAWSGLVDGRVIACVGVLDRSHGNGEAWALLAHDAGRWMAPITRASARYLRITPFRRVEATVDPKFQPARRWVQMLGFEHEGPARAYLPDGSDAERWARVRR